MRKLSFNSLLSLTLSGNCIEVCTSALRHELPIFSHPYIDDALSGDAEAAGFLSSTDNNLRPLVLLCVYAACRDSAGFKSALADIWAHDGPRLLRAISAPLLSDMFKVAGVRTEPQGSVTVYRGGQGDIDVVQRGWSWTTHRGVAAWFATRTAATAEPVVLQATVNSSRIVHVCDEREEYEVVIPRGVRQAVISGTPDEWLTEAATWHAGATSHQASMLLPPLVSSTISA